MTKPELPPQYGDVSQPDRPPGSGLDAFDEVYQREFDYVWRSLGRLGVPEHTIPDATHDQRCWSTSRLPPPISPSSNGC